MINENKFTARDVAYQSALRVYNALLQRNDIDIMKDLTDVTENADEQVKKIMEMRAKNAAVARRGGGKRRKSKKVKKSRMGRFPYKRKSKKVRKSRTKKFPHKRR